MIGKFSPDGARRLVAGINKIERLANVQGGGAHPATNTLDTPTYIKVSAGDDDGRYTWIGQNHAAPNSWSDNSQGGFVDGDAAYEGNGETDVDTSKVYRAWRDVWSGHLIFFAADSVDDQPDRCACPEATGYYTVAPDCPPCNVYGYGDGKRTMPRFWFLEIDSATDNPYSDAYCEGSACESLAGLRNKLANVLDGNDRPTCSWQGRKSCITAELSLDDEWAQISIWDRNDCLLAVLRKPIEDFLCCADNTDGWELVEGSVCDLTVRLLKDPCACCEPPVCPPDGEDICPEHCCDAPCRFGVTATGDCAVPTCPTPMEDCIPGVCEATEGCECIDGNCVQTLSPCSIVGGAVQWVGGCTWYGRHEEPGRSVTITHTGARWEVRITMDCGAGVVWYRTSWDCFTDDGGWTLDTPASYCHVTGKPTDATLRVIAIP